MSAQREMPAVSRRALLAGAGASLLAAGCDTSGAGLAQALVPEAISLGARLAYDLNITEQDEINIGTQLYPRMIGLYGGPYRNRKVQAATARFADPLIRLGKRLDLPWEIVVLDFDTVNAWALPGGKLAVNKGLLRYAADDDELAAVLAHEIGHVELAHAVGEMRSERLTNAMTDTGRNLLRTQIADPTGSLLTDALIEQMMPAIRGIVTSGYSREAEFAADQHILSVFDLAGYDPRRASSFFGTLLALYPEDTKGTTSLFSSHPVTRERIAALDKAAAGKPAPALPAAGRGFDELKAPFPTRQFFRRHPPASV